MIEFLQEVEKPIAKIIVIGVGGAGGNTVNSIIASKYEYIECMVANTDSQALEMSKAFHKIQLGIKSSKGLGAGANPEVGRRAAEEDIDKVMELAKDADIVFVTGGMGGGTGSGALPVIARALKEAGVLTIAVVTKPFAFEGKRRSTIAQEAIEELKKNVDTLIIIPNQKLLDAVDQKISMIDAFAMINEVLSHCVKGISDIITKPGHINVDFADVKTVMQGRGIAVMGTGRASGLDRAEQAAMNAISSPLLENMSIQGAQGILLNITGGQDLGLHEISRIASIMHEQAHQNAHIIIGAVIDESMQNDICVTIIATGFEQLKKDIECSDVKAKGAIRVDDIIHKTVSTDGVHGKHTGQEEAISIDNQNRTTIDLHDLDVPTFLRKEISRQ
ncbi:MAG: cell division protein FtsZ [Candidatus Dependentiae bacterium]|nr:cell division protein FtsZ [Candidatus Dependentiae bacterium]